MRLIYNLAIRLYFAGASAAALWSVKAKQFVGGRKRTEGILKYESVGRHNPIWIHCASLGEFEQAMPLIEEIRETFPSQKVLVTFFSPSGYEVKKNSSEADWFAYLPMDTRKNAQKLVQQINPRFAIFIKSEFWYHYLETLRKLNIPMFFVSSVFKKHQFPLGRFSRFYELILRDVAHFFVRDDISQIALSDVSTACTVVGDTRFDRVVQQARETESSRRLKSIMGARKCIIFGSIQEADLAAILPFIDHFDRSILAVVVPHEPRGKVMDQLEKHFSESIKFSDLKSGDTSSVILVDQIGVLSSIYQAGKYAFVGGGFSGALHNILEALVFGVPVFFGDSAGLEKYEEATVARKLGAAFSVQDANDLSSIFRSLEEDSEAYQLASHAARDYVKANTGATKKVMNKIRELL